MTHSRLFRIASVIALTVAAPLSSGCWGQYHAAPEPSLVDTDKNFLTDPAAPIRVRFDPPADPSTLRLKLVRYVTDAEGNLPDEDDDPKTNFLYKDDPDTEEKRNVLFEHDPGKPDFGGKLDAGDGSVVSISLDDQPPVGPRLALLVEPGTAAKDGTTIVHRRRLLFGYQFQCSGAASTKLPSGAYFFLVDLEAPIQGVQIRLLSWLDIDPSTGRFKGRMTNASRSPNRPGCGSCSDGNVCRTLPPEHAGCVKPSERPLTTSEYPDFYANDVPPIGFTFEVSGCAEDSGDSTKFAIAPVDVFVQQPLVTVTNTTLSASFKQEGGWKGEGSLASPKVIIGAGTVGSPGKGTMHAEFIPAGQEPGHIPRP